MAKSTQIDLTRVSSGNGMDYSPALANNCALLANHVSAVGVAGRFS
ncbi:MAG: hypothetical protein IPJ27_13025 [Candidatus Accumulibacter sp.]|uniref:Uncharacterized protein n=1 Tax=Candidatus Accumulibacter proximus TaxID=2954385 RepID=A0A935UHC7_9PROT|nr:hypothetical protein [Candidatus Accumulibacter proximus]